jgi:hypothetical protein
MVVAFITVDIEEFRRRLAAFRDHKAKLLRFLDNLERTITAIGTISWVSPASKILLGKLQILVTTVRTALRIVDKYISDLEEATRLFTAADVKISDRMQSLNAGENIFGI